MSRHEFTPPGWPDHCSFAVGWDDAPDEVVAPGGAFAIATARRRPFSLEYIRHDGRSFCVPYGYAPRLWWQQDGLLAIEYPGLFSVLLRGLMLGELCRRLRDKKVIWIRQSSEAGTTGGVAVITMLEIAHYFPSREHQAGAETP